jgi:hypothetical protein
VSKPLLRDGDGLWQQVGVAVDLALLAVQTGSRPVGDVVGEPAPDEYRRHKKPGGDPPRVGIVVQMQKNVFSEFRWHNGQETPVETSPTRL